MSRKVFVYSSIPHLTHHLRLLLPNVTFSEINAGNDDVVSILSETEILIADPHLLAPYVDKLPKAKWIQATWAGLESLLSIVDTKNVPYTITRFTGESFGHSMSEYVVQQIINFERDQRKQYENQSNCLWNVDGKIANHRHLHDLVIGILGLGTIGSYIAKILKAFGSTVWGMTKTIPNKKKEFLDKLVTTESISEILRNCDYIINVLPSTECTIGLLNGKILKNCIERKPVFMNIGRGTIIKESDLINALEKNWLSGAILDVFEDEPLNINSKLWNLPQVTISPHIAGVSRPEYIAKVFTENYARFLQGDPLKNIIDAKVGY